MGVFRKYRDSSGKPTGPWFIQYPVGRDPESGKMKYTTKKASWQKKKAQEIFRKKHDEFYQKERLGVTVDPELTFKELMSWGLDQEVMRVKASAPDDVTRAGHLISHFGNMKAIQITPLMVDNFGVKMKRTISKSTGRAYSGTTINKMITLARRIYYLGMDAGIVSTNPFARRGMFKEEPQGRYIPDGEFWKLFGFLPEYLKPATLTAYLTGMRRGEILDLTWERVDLFKGYIDLTPADTKTGEPRHIYLNTMPELKRVFVESARQKKSGQKLVFTKPDGSPLPKHYMDRLFKRACKKAKVGPYRFHDLRHTFNTNMVKAGVDRAVIMRLTGHKTLAMFLRYSHLDREQGEAAMEMLSGLLSKKKDQTIALGPTTPKKEEQDR